MTREEAARLLDWAVKNFEPYGDNPISEFDIEAYRVAISALRQPGWVKTADRVPEGGEMELVQGAYQHREWGFMLHEIIAIGWLKSHPEMYPYWMPLPPLPETVGLEGTKINGGE